MISRMARIQATAAALMVLAAGCGEDDEPAARKAAAVEPSPILGAYEQRATESDLGEDPYYDRASLGIHRLSLDADSYESFTPKGPGIAGPGKAAGTRYTFDADPRRDCTEPATYEVVVSGDTATLTPVGNDPCATREVVLTTKPWRRAPR